MRIRAVTFAAAVGALGALAGCGDKCNEQTPPVAGVPNCTAQAGTQVTVPIQVCPKCDQEASTCTVDMAAIGQNVIELVPLSEVCDASSSCPIVDPVSCPARPAGCTFTAPTTPGDYDLVVVTEAGRQVTRTLTVVSSGALSCSGFTPL
jgi:hypothetical protein